MDREYQIFECLPDGSFLWRDTASGLNSARRMLDAFSKRSSNDHFAVYLPTGEFVFRAAEGRRGPIVARRAFQVAYTEKLRRDRAEILRARGYGVVSVVGNDAAKLLLTNSKIEDEITLFLVGHAAPIQTRTEIVSWLRERYPKAKILALNPPGEKIASADLNAVQNGPERWLTWLAGI